MDAHPPDPQRLDRCFRYLTGVIDGSYPQYLAHPFDVASLVQTILPYRHHRRQLEVDSYEAYELLLMHLLSSADGLLIVSERVRDFLREELGRATPDVTAYRRFADEPISLSPDSLRVLEDQSRLKSVSPDGIQRAEPLGVCRHCGCSLPRERAVTFCPACGENLLVVRCSACNTELEPQWRFCIACGRRMSRPSS